MSDLTMCSGTKGVTQCAMRMHCKRFTDKPSEHQSYFSEVPFQEQRSVPGASPHTCTWIWDTNKRQRG